MKENKSIDFSAAGKTRIAEFQRRSLDKNGNDKRPPIDCEIYRLGPEDYNELSAFHDKQMKDLEKKGQTDFFDPYSPEEFISGLGINIAPDKRCSEIFGVYVEKKLAAFIVAHYAGDPYCEFLRENSIYDKDVLDKDKFGKFSSVISYMVDQEFQGYGLQRKMIKILAEISAGNHIEAGSTILKQKNVTQFAAEVDEANERSYKNCYSQGFRARSRALQYSGIKPNGEYITTENYEILLTADAKTIIKETEKHERESSGA